MPAAVVVGCWRISASSPVSSETLGRSRWLDCRPRAAEVPCLRVISRMVPCRHGWLHVRMLHNNVETPKSDSTTTNPQHTMTASNTGPSTPPAILGDFLLEACQRRSSCDADL